MFLDKNVLYKALMLGFINGVKIGRNLKYDRKKYIHRFQHNKKKQ